MGYKKSQYSMLWLLPLASMLMVMCGPKQDKIEKPFELVEVKEPLVKANKYLAKTEEREIEEFVARYSWQMSKTGTGLRYMIYKKNHKGKRPSKLDRVVISYKISFINGTFLDSTEKNNPRTIVIGERDVESGLEEGLQLMKTGEKAKMIIPSHLAYGLVGDDKKIPKRATLIYEVELIKVIK